MFAQGEIQERETMFMDDRTVALHVASHGFGADYRYHKRIDNFKKRIYSVDVAYIKDPKEIKRTNPYALYQKQFVFGKVNNFYNIRAGLGLQKKMFSKMDKGGIEINWFYQFGPTLGILKPIYYEVFNFSTQEYSTEKFDPNNIHSEYDILGKASFFKGFNELTIAPGGFAKIGFNFEFSQNDKLVKYIEGGGSIDVFSRSIPIMATEENNLFFFALFLHYRFGKTVNTRVSRRYQKEHPEEFDQKIKLDDIRF
jgi:hypothetical protein